MAAYRVVYFTPGPGEPPHEIGALVALPERDGGGVLVVFTSDVPTLDPGLTAHRRTGAKRLLRQRVTIDELPDGMPHGFTLGDKRREEGALHPRRFRRLGLGW